MLKKLAMLIGVGAAVALDQVLLPAKVAEPRQPTSARRIAKDDYQGVERSPGGGFMPAGEVREDAWVRHAATEGRDKATVLAEEEAARADVPSLTVICASTWAHRVAMHEAGELYFEGDGDMSDEAREARYGPGWRELL